MPKILRTYNPDYGGLEVFTDADDTPVYLAAGTLPFDGWAKTGKVDQAFVDGVIAQRQAAKVESDKRAVVDAAVQAELAKRLASVDYSKSGADAVTAVFGAAVKP